MRQRQKAESQSRRPGGCVAKPGGPAALSRTAILSLALLPVVMIAGCLRQEESKPPAQSQAANAPPPNSTATDQPGPRLPLPALRPSTGAAPSSDSLAPRPDANTVVPSPGSPAAPPAVSSSATAEAAAPPIEAPLPQSTAELIAEVRAVVDELVQWGPDNLDCLEMKARFLDWLGKSEEAENVWRQCLEREPRYVHALVGLAAVAVKRGRHTEAIAHAQQAVDADPYSFRARDILAEALINENRPADAVDALVDFLKRDPRAHGYFLLGRAYTLLDDLPNARKAYEDAVRVYPDYAESHYALARICLRLGDRDASQKHLATYQRLMKRRDPHEQGMEMGRDDFKEMKINAAIIYTDAGRIYLARGIPQIAERLWRRAAALDPSSVPARELIARLMMDEERWSQAIQLFDELIRLAPAEPRWMLAQAQAYAFAKQTDQAKRVLAEASRRWPDRVEVHAARARFLAALGQDLDEAVQSAERVVQQRPNGIDYALLAWTRFRSGDTAGAEQAIRKALELDPANPEVQRVSAVIRAANPAASENPASLQSPNSTKP